LPALTSAGTVSVQLEAVSEALPLMVEKEGTLDKMIQDRGRAKRVSTRNYRIPLKTNLPGSVSKINLDQGDFPRGSGTGYDLFQVTPLAFTVPLELTKLVELTGKGQDVATVDVVNDNIADAAAALRRFRDVFLQTAGTGQLATVASTYAGGGANPITLASTPFGARLLAKDQTVQVFNPTGNVLRGTMRILKIQNTLGSTQTITVDAVPAGTVANDLIMVAGVEQGTPIFINGIPVFHSTSATGTLMGIDRSNVYTQANGVNAGSVGLVQPLLRLAMNQIRQALGDDALTGIFFHTHPSQGQAYEELGFQIQYIPLEGGKADGMDLLFRGKKEVSGKPWVENIHADQTRIDLMNTKVWGKVKWGDPPFWYELEGQRVFPISNMVALSRNADEKIPSDGLGSCDANEAQAEDLPLAA